MEKHVDSNFLATEEFRSILSSEEGKIAIKTLQTIGYRDTISKDDFLEEMKKTKREIILSQHQFTISQQSDGRWKTYVPDKTKKNGRRLIAKKTKEAVEEAVIACYQSEEENKVLTLRKVYPIWLEYKNTHTNRTSYIKRLNADWKKYYLNDPIIDMDMKGLTVGFLDQWAHKKIKQYKLSKTAYYNMAVIIRQIFDYEVSLKNLEENTFSLFTVKNKKVFTKKTKPDDSTQVYLINEEQRMIDYAWEAYHKRPRYTSSLAIAFMFYIGCRVGELVALKFSDIKGDEIHIHRMEYKNYELVDSAEIQYTGTKIADDETKTEAGDRWVYLPEEARRIIECVKQSNEMFDLYDDDYIFVSCDHHKGNHMQRIRADTIANKLINYCKETGIDKKSTHKIRKTYISTLIDENVNINTIRKMVGHQHENTTYKSYCFDRHEKNEIAEHLEKIFSNEKVTKN